MLGLLKPDSGTIWVLGHRVDLMNEAQLMGVRHHMGMVFQEGALFDSFTVGENVGYKLYEETAHAARRGARSASRKCSGSSGSSAHVDKLPSALSGGQRRRVAIARAMAAQADAAALRRGDHRPRSDDGADRGRRGRQAARSRARDLGARHAPAARRVLRRHARSARAARRRRSSWSKPREAKIEEADFVMIREGRVVVRGLRRRSCATRKDPYLQKFLS